MTHLPRSAGIALALLPLLLVSLAGCTRSGSAGSCAPTLITVSPATLTAGEDVTISADPVYAECNDTNDGVLAPASDVPVELLFEDGTRIALGDVSADDRLRAEGTFPVPEGTPTGTARLSLGDLASTDVEVVG